MKKISVSRCKKFATVSNVDFLSLSQHRWYLGWTTTKTGKIYYAYRKIENNISVKMHRQIMGLSYGDVRLVDHRDRNGLNNRRSNLRIANKSKNAGNATLRSDNTSGFKGVSVFRNKFQAKIQYLGKQIRLGVFSSSEKAAKAYNRSAKKLFGKFARLNLV